MARREDYGFISTAVDPPPHDSPLLDLQRFAAPPEPNAFGTPILNFTGIQSNSSPPDTTGDVGLTHFLQAANGTTSLSNSAIRIFNKSGAQVGSDFMLQSLASGAPCSTGFCDPIVLFDEMANRWVISEFPSSGGHLCVYVSQTSDPTGSWYAYTFMNVETSTPDYPKYGVWPLDTNGDGQYMEGSYLIGVNAGSGGKDLIALDRGRMLQGLSATFQKFTVPALSGFGFQLLLPGNHEGDTPPPAGNQAGVFLRPVDTEIHTGKTCSPEPCDLMEMYAVTVDWATPASSVMTKLPDVKIAEYDHTLCGTGSTWNCMPQPGTAQKIDPIREPIHFPLQYRNFGDRESLVGCFVEDIDGTDHAALRWFEIRKSAGTWSLFQEGVVGGEANVHRSIGSAAMDGSGNIAMGYTRTGTTAPYYPSIYYKGRLSTDAAGTMPYGEYVIQDATTSKTDNERYGDYAGIGVDPSDDCTFWFVTEYGGSGQTKIATFKFDACGCLAVPTAPTANISVPQNNRLTVGWNDSATTTITQYWVFRATTAGGPYTQIATVPDSSPGVGGGAAYAYNDDTVSGGTRYYYVVKSNDGVSCTSLASNEVNALATGACTLAPAFAGVTAVSNPAGATCTLNLSWGAGTASCAGPLRYNVYRSTTSGFTPGAGNRIAQNLSATSYSDLDQLDNGTRYYYIVRAVDSSNGQEEANTSEQSGVPTGPITTGTLTETFEAAGGFDTVGWTHSALTGAVDWTWSTAGNPNTPTHTWFSASQSTAADRAMVSPTFGVLANTTLSFWHTYAFESATTCYDGGTLEITTDGGTTWTVIPDAAFTAGLFNGTASSGNPIAGKRAWCGGTIGTMVNVAVNLGSYAGQNARVRWHAGEDSSQAVTGWYIDSVTISNAGTAGSCATGSACANNPTLVNVTPDGPLTLCGGATQTLTAAPTGGTGAAYQWYDGATPIDGATGSTYIASGTGTHSYNCKVTGTGCSTGMMDGAAVTITWQSAPTFTGLSSVTNPQGATCTLDLAWGAAASVCPGTLTYKVYRSTTSPVSTVPGNLVATVAGTSHSDTASLVHGTVYYYVVHAVDGAGQEDANAIQHSGVPTGAISASTLMTESFDGATFPPTGWTEADVSGTAGDWARVTASTNPSGITPHSGAGMAEFNSFHSASTSSTRIARTGALSIPVGTTAAAAILWVYHETGYTSNADRIQVQTSPDGTTWTNRGTAINRYDGSTGWKQHSIDLSALIGAGNFQIGYLGISAYGNDTYLDDVSVETATAVSCTTGALAPGETAPGDVVGTAQAWGVDKSTHSWPANPQAANGYKLLLGTPAQLVELLDGDVDSCRKWTGTGTTCTLSDTPASGSFYWYLVLGVNGAGDGSPGSGTAGARVVNYTTGTCP